MRARYRSRRVHDARSFTSAALALMLATAFLVPLGAGAQTASPDDDFVLGSGRSDARVLRIGPSSGQLGLTPSAAVSLADFLGTVGRGESRPFDWAALEGTIEDADEDFFDHHFQGEDGLYPPVRVESTDEDSEQGTDRMVPPFTQHARADDTPRGFSETTLSGFEIPGLMTFSGGRASAFAGLATRGDTGDLVREAGGVVRIGDVSFFDGVVSMSGLYWEVRQRTDADENVEVTGRFVVGSADVGGQQFEGPISGDDLQPLFDGANQALAPLGFALRAPQLDDEAGNARLGPLALSIVDSQLGNLTLAPILDGIQPLREAIVDPFLEECEDCAAFVLIADVLIGVFSGAGRFDIELGGAFGFTEGERFENPFAFDVPAFDEQPAVITEPAVEATDPTVIEETIPGSDPVVEEPAEEILTISPQAAPDAAGIPTTSSVLWALATVTAAAALWLGAVEYRRLRLRRLGLPA